MIAGGRQPCFGSVRLRLDHHVNPLLSEVIGDDETVRLISWMSASNVRGAAPSARYDRLEVV